MSVMAVEGLPEIRAGDDLAELISGKLELEDGDVVVVAQKAVSKAEGRVLRLDEIEPSERHSSPDGETKYSRPPISSRSGSRMVASSNVPAVVPSVRHKVERPVEMLRRT